MPAPAPVQLPAVEFTVVHPPHASPRVHNPQQLAPYGYNTGDDWDHYIRLDREGAHGPYLRWLQPMEADLARQVEYDMDEQDQLWLDALNRDRKRDGHPQISYEVFEIIMDKIEKEWFDLTRNIPKRTNALPSEDSKCAICDDGECENANAIVFCDGCNLAVHQDCYGVPYIPEGQWLCRKCTVSPDKPVACVLCPRPYGAFKQTTTGQWAHLLCAIWIPDTSVSNTVYMEPVDGVEHIPKSRWKLVCYLCKKRVGACIQCANRSCYTAFHVTCAREHGLSLKMKQGAASGELRAFCDKHGETPLSRAATPKAGPSTPSGIGSFNAAPQSLLKLTLRLPPSKTGSGAGTKSARAYKTSFARAPPVVPAKLAERITAYISRIKLPGKKEVVNIVCRYWSLKREARRGAPLLKRIHLEPWTASATTRQQSEADKAHKLALLRLVRNDLEKVRMLTELVRKRERKKLDRANCLRGVVESVVFPLEGRMRDALEAIKALDKQHYFLRPVDEAAVPDYYDLIHFPMDWSTMADKLARHEYLSGVDFTGDVRLVINNARRYNAPSSTVHRAAIKLLASAEPLLAALDAADSAGGGVSVGEVLDAEMRDALFEFGYDVRDPEGHKARRREEKERRAREEAEQEVRGANGKGKGRARDDSEEAEEQVEDDGDAQAGAPAPPQPQKGKKRSAALAGLDSPAPRTTRAGTVAAAVAGPGPRTTRSGATPVAKKAKAKDEAQSERVNKDKAKERAGAASPVKKEAAMLDDVDPKASFKHFETGWVLPEGSRRRSSASASASGTPRVGAVPLPPTPGSADSLALAPPPVSTRKGRGRAVEPVAEEDEGEGRAETEVETKPPPAKKPRIAEPPQKPAAPTSPKKEAGGAADTPKKEAGIDAEQVRQYDRRMAELHPQIEITPKTELSEGYLVWARQPPYPFFPAEVVDPDAKDTPAFIRANRPTGKSDDKVPVLFFDPNRSGGWIARANLRGLGESAEADTLLLSRAALASIRRKQQNGKQNKPYAQALEELKDAYEWAMQNAENTDDERARLADEKEAGGSGAKKGKGKRRPPAGAGRKKR